MTMDYSGPHCHRFRGGDTLSKTGMERHAAAFIREEIRRAVRYGGNQFIEVWSGGGRERDATRAVLGLEGLRIDQTRKRGLWRHGHSRNRPKLRAEIQARVWIRTYYCKLKDMDSTQ